MASSRCPDRNQLREFLVGTVSPGDFGRIAGHSETCGACEPALELLDPEAGFTRSRRLKELPLARV